MPESGRGNQSGQSHNHMHSRTECSRSVHAARRQLCRNLIELFLDRSGVNHVETRRSAPFRGLTSRLGDNSFSCFSKYRFSLYVISISSHAVLRYSNGYVFSFTIRRLMKLLPITKGEGRSCCLSDLPDCIWTPVALA